VRLTTARRLRETPVDCARWAAEEPSGSLEDLETSTLARYSAFIRGTGYESPPQTFDRAADLLRSYRLFPPEVIESTVCTPDARIAPGAVVVQRSFVGPLAVESAVRVDAVEDELTFAGRRAAFSVVTLRGHPLRGAETVALLMHETGRIELHFTSASRPAGLLARLGGPFTRWMQVRANRAALAYFRSLVADTGPRAEPPSPRNAQRLTLWETSEIETPTAVKAGNVGEVVTVRRDAAPPRGRAVTPDEPPAATPVQRQTAFMAADRDPANGTDSEPEPTPATALATRTTLPDTPAGPES
jgi:uncharacterized protein (UPF0548 family)